MKIEGPGKSSGVKGASKTGAKKGASGVDFNDMLRDAGGVEETAGVSGVMAVSQIESLLSLQEAGDGTSGGGAKQARERAESLLDQLEKIRIGILEGTVSVATLQNLAKLAASGRGRMLDPKLAEILDEIDLRAQVELAKLGKL